METAFVLGGGGVLGAHEIGMLRALAEAGIRPDVVIRHRRTGERFFVEQIERLARGLPRRWLPGRTSLRPDAGPAPG